MKRICAIAAWMLLAAWPAAAQSGGLATLTVRVENVSPKGGIVRLGLYDQAAYPDNDARPTAYADVKAEPGETVITLKDVPPGIYAVQTYQDINANGKMDTSWLGFPLEPFGFSRDARPRFGKPRFDAVKFTLVAGTSSQTIHLQNSVSLFAGE